MFGDGQECPNQACVSSWKAFNLHTGKPILAEAFHNTHWITPESNGPAKENCQRSHRNSKRRKSGQNTMQHQDNIHSSRAKSSKRTREGSQHNSNKIDWTSIYTEIQKCRNFEELEVLVDSLDESSFDDLHCPIMPAGRDAVVDPFAAYHFPADGPKNLILIVTDTDGNCFCRAVSGSLFGTEEEYNMLQMRIVIKCIMNKQSYLDNNYLMNGAAYIHTRGTFPQRYALFLGLNIPLSGTGNLDD